MTTLKVERLGDGLIIRLTHEAEASLGLRAGDEVQLGRSLDGEISLAAFDIDHQMRLDRGHAFLRRLRGPL